MDDLISRQAAIDALDTGLWGVEWDKALATAMLKDLPSAQPEIIDIAKAAMAMAKEADLVAVTRCKDCKHWCIHKRLDIPWCRNLHIDRGADDFCSYAERRTDE